MSDTSPLAPYQFTTIEYTYPDPKYRDHGSVSVEFYDGHGIQRTAGAIIDVGTDVEGRIHI